MDDNNKDGPHLEAPDSTTLKITNGDMRALAMSARQLHAQIRLITAGNFTSFLDLSRQEQLDVLSGLLPGAESLIEILEQASDE